MMLKLGIKIENTKMSKHITMSAWERLSSVTGLTPTTRAGEKVPD